MQRTILHLTSMESTKYGGLEHYLIETVRQCNKFGYRTVIQYDDRPRSSAYRRDLNDLGTGIVTIKLQLNPLTIAKLIYSLRPQIIHTHFPNKVVLFETAIIAKVLGVPNIIHTEHTNTSSHISIIRRWAYNRYNHVLCVSNAVYDDLSRAGVDQNILSAHYLGVCGHIEQSAELRDKFRNEFRIPCGDNVLACIAFDHPFKGLDTLLKSFQQVSEAHSTVHLIIIGVDPDRSQLPTIARKLGISERVHWSGIRDEGWQVLNAADFYVQSSRVEGLGLATIEAMALNLPVVATRVGGLSEIVRDGETGFLCTPDVHGLTKAMGRMLSQPEQWERMGRAGYRRYMEMLRGEKSVETLVQRYYCLLRDYR